MLTQSAPHCDERTIGFRAHTLARDERTLEIFVFEDFAAIETFNVIHPVSAGDDLGARVLTSGLHNSA